MDAVENQVGSTLHQAYPKMLLLRGKSYQRNWASWVLRWIRKSIRHCSLSQMKNSDATAQVTLMISKIMVPPLPLRNWGYLTLSFVVLTSLLIFSTMSERCLIYPSTRFTLGQTVQLYVAGTRDISRHLSTIESHTSWSSLDQSTGIMSENRKSCRLCFKGFFPTELLQHYLWWNDPTWLKLESLSWPLWSESPQTEEWHEEEIVLCSVTVEKKKLSFPLISTRTTPVWNT